jgi:predicted O-methyltransferase YrrM
MVAIGPILRLMPNSLKQRILCGLMPMPFPARHREYSAIASLDDDPAGPTARLIDLSLRSIIIASETNLEDVSKRMKKPPFYPDVWPGEHYKLLAGFVNVLKPKNVIEIGTGSGLSGLAMLTTLAHDAKITTFDIAPWQEIPDTCLVMEDFDDGRLEQVIANLAEPSHFESHRDVIESADLIFLDGPKNVAFENTFLQRIEKVGFKSSLLMIIDDIRVWNMLRIWRDITRPKLDLTSFGHWSGTGIVDWKRTDSVH